MVMPPCIVDVPYSAFSSCCSLLAAVLSIGELYLSGGVWYSSKDEEEEELEYEMVAFAVCGGREGCKFMEWVGVIKLHETVGKRE